MANKLLPVPKSRFTDSNGQPLAGGKLYSYIANTTTPLATYADQTELAPNENPVVLDANGEAHIWIKQANYKFILTDADDVTQWTVDNVSAVEETLSGSVTAQAAAEAARDAAQTAKTGAESAQTAAATSESNAATSAIAAATSASNSATSASQSSTSASNAATSASAALTSQNAAATSASSAATSASAASTSASNAATSASNAATSESNTANAVSTHAAVTTSVHGIADTAQLVTLAGTQTLTNKTLTAPVINGGDFDGGTASSTNRITIPKNTHTNLQALPRKEGTFVYSTDRAKAFVDNGTNLIEVGSGSGSGATNFLPQDQVENGATTGWNLFNVTMSSGRPTGVPTYSAAQVSITADNTNPLKGTYSLLVTANTASVGQGVISDAFTIDRMYAAKILAAKFGYEITTGQSNFNLTNTTASTWHVYIYNVTATEWIQPINCFPIQGTADITPSITFQTNLNPTHQYRLAILCGNNPAGLVGMRLDDFSVGPQITTQGAFVSDWQSYTPIVTATTTNPTIGSTNYHTARYRRVGDSAEIEYSIYQTTAGTAGSGAYLFNLPPGLTIDATKTRPVADGNQHLLGPASGYDNVNAGKIGHVFAYTATQLAVQMGDEAAAPSTVGSGFASFANSTVTINFKATVPIVGWGSSQVLSSETSGRAVTLVAPALAFTAASTSSTWTRIPGSITPTQDTAGGWSNSGGFFRYTIKEPGDYDYSWTMETGVGAGTKSARFYINGVSTSYGKMAFDTGTYVSGASSGIMPNLKAGDYIDFYYINYTASETWATGVISISKRAVSGQQIAQVPTYVFRAVASTTSTVYNVGTTLVFPTVQIDSHGGCYDPVTGIWTAPYSGIYYVTGRATYASAAVLAGRNGYIYTTKNGTSATVEDVLGPLDKTEAAYTWAQSNILAGPVRMLQGETLRVRALQGYSGGNIALDGGSANNFFSIVRVGNYA